MTKRTYDEDEVSIRECIFGAYCWLDALTTDLNKLLCTLNMLKRCDDNGKLKEQIGTVQAASTEAYKQCKVMLKAVGSMSHSLKEGKE